MQQSGLVLWPQIHSKFDHHATDAAAGPGFPSEPAAPVTVTDGCQDYPR